MASILKILRRVGGAKAPPASGSAGELALWKAGAGVNDLRALYVHDGTQFVPLVDYASETLPGLAAFATRAEVDALVVANKIVTPATLHHVIKPRLFADRTYYVRPNGADTNNGLADTAAGAFKTINAAVKAAAELDQNTYNVTIQIAAGNYPENVVVQHKPNGKLTLLGNTAAPSTVLVDPPSGIAIGAYEGASVRLDGMAVKSVNGTGVSSSFGSQISIVNSFEAQACKTSQFFASTSGRISVANCNLAITGSAQNCFVGEDFGAINLGSAHLSVSAGLTFSKAFVAVNLGSNLKMNTACTFTGTFTGKSYDATANSVVSSSGRGPNFFAGSIAGTTATGGQYV